MKWLESYLKGRVQFVCIDEVLSKPILVSSGVPQGSHLGPLLFLIFINDLPSIFLNSSQLLFADDLKFFRCIKSINDCHLLQDDISKLSQWCTKNQLYLNVAKCQCFSFCRNFSEIIFDYKIENQVLERVREKKDLGVVFDPKLNFVKHIEFSVSKANSMLGFIKRNSIDFKDPFTLKSLFTSYVRPILEYCCVIWNPFYNIQSKRIEMVQKKFTRFTIQKFGWNIETPSYKTRCQLLAIQSLENRRKMFSVMFISDILSYHIKCPFLLSLINLYAPSRQLRIRCLFREDVHRVNYAKNEPITRCVKETNLILNCIDFDFQLSRSSLKNKILLAFYPRLRPQWRN